MEHFVKVKTQSVVTFDDYQDINALREMADIVCRELNYEMRGAAPTNYNRQRAYAISLWIQSNLPEASKPCITK